MPRASKSSSSPSGDATPPPAQSTEQTASTPIPSNVDQSSDNDQDGQREGSAAYNNQSVDGDADASFWNIIADSHMNLETYGEQAYDEEMTEPTSSFLSSASTMAVSSAFATASAPSTNLPPVYDDLIGSEALAPPSLMMASNHASYPRYVSSNQFVTFEPRQDHTPFPLSKPIIREDGLLLVGTELVADGSMQTADRNRIFVTNYLSTGAAPASRILVDQEVRDLHWMGTQAAIVAVGKEIQLIQLGDLSVGGSCTLQDPINTVHSDIIRELAISPTTSHVLSGGFDETIVLTDLRTHGDPRASAIIGKLDANDVVSSVRWSPMDSYFSWTTDGGDFQVADSRTRAPQLQVPLYSFLNVSTLGGLFTHEYLSSFIIALGFERGHMALIDTRMPRQNACTSLIESKLGAVGEIRRSNPDKFAIFGRGGFSTAHLNAAANNLEHISLLHQSHQVSSPSYKTSGDFSFERGDHFAVSDNLGVVSVYTDDAIFGSTAASW